MIYLLFDTMTEKNKKILLVVPTTSLVEQMFKDFQDYGWDAENYCHRIYAGKEKTMKILSQLQLGNQSTN